MAIGEKAGFAAAPWSTYQRRAEARARTPSTEEGFVSAESEDDDFLARSELRRELEDLPAELQALPLPVLPLSGAEPTYVATMEDLGEVRFSE